MKLVYRQARVFRQLTSKVARYAWVSDPADIAPPGNTYVKWNNHNAIGAVSLPPRQNKAGSPISLNGIPSLVVWRKVTAS